MPRLMSVAARKAAKRKNSSPADDNPSVTSLNAPSTPSKNRFDLSLEINQHIASFLPDKDIKSFQRICKATRDAIATSGGLFWRQRFLARFDRPIKKMTSSELQELYKKRMAAMKNGARFGAHEDKKEYTITIKPCLLILRDMIVDSFSAVSAADASVDRESLNLEFVKTLMVKFDLIADIFSPKVTSNIRYYQKLPSDNLLYTIQVMLAPFMLSLAPQYKHYALNFPETQQVVYGTFGENPMLIGANSLTIDMSWMMHQINFWKYHMLRSEELTLYQAFSDLQDSERPRAWLSRLGDDGCKLSQYWKGSYAYVDRPEVFKIRTGRGLNGNIQDEFNSETETGAFQDMKLDLTEPDAMAWPPLFEEVLESHSLPKSQNPQGTPKKKTRAQHSSAFANDHVEHDYATAFARPFRFDGTGKDQYEEFLADGWLNPLPPQNGIPGWQRLTMMKYFTDEDGEIDTEALWAYEGIVLPGGQMVFGRWWCVADGKGEEMYSGPFILWSFGAAQAEMKKAETGDEEQGSG